MLMYRWIEPAIYVVLVSAVIAAVTMMSCGFGPSRLEQRDARRPYLNLHDTGTLCIVTYYDDAVAVTVRPAGGCGH